MRHPKRTQLRCPGENGRSDSSVLPMVREWSLRVESLRSQSDFQKLVRKFGGKTLWPLVHPTYTYKLMLPKFWPQWNANWNSGGIFQNTPHDLKTWPKWKKWMPWESPGIVNMPEGRRYWGFMFLGGDSMEPVDVMTDLGFHFNFQGFFKERLFNLIALCMYM